MAQRRMFSQRIVGSGRFLKMSPSAQNLYFHLGMRADDDGVVEAEPIMKMLGSVADDFSILIAKDFVRPLNNDLVVVITDWREHNLIRADRKIDSIYKELLIEKLPQFPILEAKQRADRPKDVETGRPVDVNGTAQVRLGQVRLVPNAFQENLKSEEKTPTEKKPIETEKKILPSFEEFMEEKGYVFGELRDNDGGVIDMWLNGNRGVSAGLYKSLQADHKRLYPSLYVGKTAPPLKESVIDEIVVIWNNYHTLPANLGAFNNTTAKTLLPKVDHESFDLKREIKKKLKFYPHVSDWERAIKAYASEILNRDPSQSYALHRLSLYEFVLQKNGLIKFFNK